MALYFKKLKAHRVVICILAVILAFQAAFALAVPYFTGQLIGVGIQQKGIDADYPEKLTDKAMNVFGLVLPKEEYGVFCTFYEKQDGFYAVSASADSEKLSELYENGVLGGFYMALDKAGNKLGSLDDAAVKSMMNLATVGNLYSVLVNYGNQSETEKEEYYLQAQQAPESLKGQIAGMALPYFYSDAGCPVEDIQKDYFARCGVLMAVFVLLQTVCGIVAGRLSARVSSRIQAALRHELIVHTSNFTQKQRRILGKDLYGVFVSDVNNAGTVTEFLLSAFLYAPFVLAGGIILSFGISAALSAVVIATVLVAMVIVFMIYKLSLPAYDRLQHFYGVLVRSVRTAVSQLYTIRTMQTTEFERNRYLSASDKVRENERFVLRSVFNALSLIALLSNIITAVAVIVSGRSLLSADMGIGDVIAFLQYSVLTVSAMTTLTGALLFAPRAKTSFESINEIMSVSVDSERLTAGETLEEDIATLEFREVSLENGVKNISFVAERGKITAVTGPTGCGKTTLLKLLTDDSEKIGGEVLLNGISINKISLQSIRKKISFANGIPMIFSGTVRDNMIFYGAESEEAMDAALDGAAVDFISDKDVVLHNNASRFSGGQRSRVALACALSKKADIYIVDDCLRAVDAHTEDRILSYLRKLSRDSIVILVSSRINSLMQADRIVVLADEVQTVGTHGELINTCSFYRKLASLQGMEVADCEK